ncbi:hypothetical protein [Aminicella lysinilytica]|uniref:hypothetical protein n=1 Tax=Aminicella lysinilytica TaxID=433323 RepID=UPI0017BC6037|nr:hypothetical protein [Aminicella lysinilytica]NLD10554.1 hypothetical protein [Clostridiales bacterium]
MKNTAVDYPAYLELGLKDGQVSSVNGKEFNKTGVEKMIEYVCEGENVTKTDVINKVHNLQQNNGSITLKLFDGAVTAI